MTKNFKIVISTILFGILLFSCKKQHSKFALNENNKDSLMNLAYQTKDLKLRLEIANKIYADVSKKEIDSISRSTLINLASLYYGLNEEKYCKKICEFFIADPSIPIDHTEVALANYYLASYNYNKGNYETSFSQYSKAEKSLKFTKYLDLLCRTLNVKAQILLTNNDFVDSELNSIKALQIALQKEDYASVVFSLISLGNALEGLNNLEKASEYYEKAIETNENLKNTDNYNTNKALALNSLSNIFILQNKLKKAEDYAKQGLAIENFKNTNPTIYCYLTNKVGYAQFRLGNKKAIEKFEETLKIGNAINSIVIQITSKKRLGEIYLAAKDTTKAIIYFEDSKEQAHKNKIFDDELSNLRHLMTANPVKEAFYAKRHIILNDSLQNVERATREKFARLAFETDEIIVEKEKFEAVNKVLSNSLFIIVVFGLLIILIIVLIFNNKTQKAKTKELFLKQEQQIANATVYKLMLAQQDELEAAKSREKQRISRDLHDGVMGKLLAVRMNIYTALYNAASETKEAISGQIKEIKAVEIEIRNISHDLSSSVFNQKANFISIVKNLITTIESHSKITFKIEVNDGLKFDETDYNTKINLYRIIQEALQNIEKYADATNVSIYISKTAANQIALSITDDGKGFDVASNKGGIGIKNMTLRATDLGGTFEITSEINIGTKINLSVPV